jgi:hypothetical protein
MLSNLEPANWQQCLVEKSAQNAEWKRHIDMSSQAAKKLFRNPKEEELGHEMLGINGGVHVNMNSPSFLR